MLEVRALLGRHPATTALVALMVAAGAVAVGLWARRDPDPPGSILRVWSWNALANSYEGPAGILDDRLAALADEAAEGSDLIGFQEIDLDGADRVTERFGDDFGWLPSESECLDLEPGASPDQTADHCAWVEKHDPVLIEPEGVAIVSRYQLRDLTAEVLTGDTYGPNDPNRRVVLAGTVSAGGSDVRVYVTHLATKCGERNEQAQRIVELIDADRARFERPFSAVVMGDMNTTPQTKKCDDDGSSRDEALYVFLDGGMSTPWAADPCVAFCDFATEDGLRRCDVNRADAPMVLTDPKFYEPCGFTLRRKESWNPDDDLPAVPYQTVDYVLVEGRIAFEAYERPWFRGHWVPGGQTRDQQRFERFLAISDHLPVQTAIRIEAR